MGENMCMTNKQFQGFVRLSLGIIKMIIAKYPDDENVKALYDAFQLMIEDEEVTK